MADDFEAQIKQIDLTKWLKEHGYGYVTAHVLQLFITDILAVYAETQRQHKQQLQDWFANFLVNISSEDLGKMVFSERIEWKRKKLKEFEAFLSEGSSRTKKVQGLEH